MTLFEHAISMDMLYNSWQKISMKNARAGIDSIDISLYRTDLQKNLRSLQTSVENNRYVPYNEISYANHKGRNISISCIDEKILQTALSKIISLAYSPAKSVHGCIPKRSIFTAKKALDTAIANGVLDFSKVDIEHFYDRVDIQTLRRKIESIIDDARLSNLISLLLENHTPGISTGSCISPVLANLYLSDADRIIEKSSIFYSRYVDDMLVAPVNNIRLIKNSLAEIGLEINADKSKAVNAADGFIYLGFDIKREVDAAIINGNFALANKIYETQVSDISAEHHENAEPTHAMQGKAEDAAAAATAAVAAITTVAVATAVSAIDKEYPAPNAERKECTPLNVAVTDYAIPDVSATDYVAQDATNAEHSESTDTMRSEYALPNIIRNVIRKCHFVSEIVEKAQFEHNLGLLEKTHLLQIFHCLGDDGARFIHHILSNCIDYDYAETQRRIKSYKVSNPVGCKKICERMGGSDKCACNFTNEKIYPTPIIHALRVDHECFKPIYPKDNIGHFRAKNPQDKAADALSAILDLNKKLYEITEQKSIFKGQIEDLFDRLNTSEYHTPQGLLIKNDDGIFIKVC